MSASLVGSEMCIRDRDGPAGAPEAHFRGSGGAVAPPGRPHPGHLDGSEIPVSYTHLTLPTICSV
eukprot:7155035-Alexandrium_andersonii.AAC.1